MATTDALDVLLGALPTAQASIIASQLSVSLPPLNTLLTTASRTSSTQSLATTASTSASSAASLTTYTSNGSTHTTAAAALTTFTSNGQTYTSAASLTTFTSNGQTYTSAVGSTSTSAAAAPTAAAPTALSAGQIAGIVVGTVIGFAIIILLMLLCLRRRDPGEKNRESTRSSGRSSLLGSFGKRRQKVYPEVAWLYDPVRPGSRGGGGRGRDPLRTAPGNEGFSQDPARSPGMVRQSDDGAPRMAANAPWSSRPSTGAEPSSPTLPAPTQTDPLDAAMFRSGRDRSVSNPRRYYSPTAPQEEHHQDSVSPLLSQSAQPSGRFGRRVADYEQSPYTQHNGMVHAAPEGAPMMSEVGFSPYNAGRAF